MSENVRKIINHTITHLLSRREHSQKELCRKLDAKGMPADIVQEQLELFVESDIQSDRRFAESLIRSRYAKGQGEVKVLHALREHNVASALVDEALAEVAPDWFEKALTVKQKKFGDVAPKDWKEQQKQSRFLQYRGFTHEQIQYAMNKD